MSARCCWSGRKHLASLLLLCASCGLATHSQGYFQDLGMGVRPIGMGEAFTAVADDSNAMLWNIAGIADLRQRELNLMYANLYANLNGRLYDGSTDNLGLNNISAVFPVNRTVGSFGMTWLQFNSKLYRENTFAIGYAREVGKDLFEWVKASERVKKIGLNAGMNLKLMNWIISGNEYTDQNDALRNKQLYRTAFTADLGLLATWTENVRFGMSLENFIPASVGVTIYETVPINFRLGVAYLHDWQGSVQYMDSLLGAVDFTQRYGYSDIRAGVEGSFFKQFLSVRLGTTVDEFTTGLSVNALLTQSPIDLRVDYAFAYPYNVQSNWGSHRFSLIVRWGEKQTKAQMVVLEPETNLASQQDQELAKARAQEEAKLKAVIEALRQEIEEVRKGLETIQTRIESGDLPRIQFESGKSVIRKESLRTLDAMGELFEKHPPVKVRLEGHTDKQGEPRGNLKLSQGRVEAVKEYLLALFKLKANNLVPVGYGDTRPVASNESKEGREQNRRVEVKVLVPAGLEMGLTQAAGVSETGKELIRPEDVVQYEDLDAIREKIKVYELQMNPQEVEELFKKQYQGEQEKKSDKK